MLCPDCGCRLEVVKTMVLDATTQRLRECGCGSRFVTVETVSRKLPGLPVTASQPPGNDLPQSSSSGSVLSLLPSADPDQTPARVEPQEPIVRTFLVAGKNTPPWGMPESFHRKLTEAFPGVDAKTEFAKVDLWAESNPHKRKTPRGMKAFLMRWFEKAQNSAGRAPTQQTLPPAVRQERERNARVMSERAKTAFGG